MSETGTAVIEHLRAALMYRPSSDEDRRMHTPPYAVPAPLEPHRQAIVDAIGARLRQQGEVRVVHRSRSAEGVLRVRTHGRPRPFSFSDAAVELLAVGAIGIDEARDLIPVLPPSCGMRRQIIAMHRDAGRIDDAQAEIAEMGTEAWVGWRDLARRWAREGDVEEFFRHWRSYKATTERTEMERLKQELVRGLTRRAGWRHALGVVRAEKRLGAARAAEVLATAAESMSSVEVAHLFSTDAVGVIDRLAELRILLDSLLREAPKRPANDPPALAGILDELIATDATVSKDVMRSRDFLLFRTWPLIGSEETLARVRKAVRTPDYRRQLTRLARDISAGDGSAAD